jgi:hypothetical protein
MGVASTMLVLQRTCTATYSHELASTLLASDDPLDYLAVKREARRVPRVRGARVDWARGLGLDAALAHRLALAR